MLRPVYINNRGYICLLIQSGKKLTNHKNKINLIFWGTPQPRRCLAANLIGCGEIQRKFGNAAAFVFDGCPPVIFYWSIDNGVFPCVSGLCNFWVVFKTYQLLFIWIKSNKINVQCCEARLRYKWLPTLMGGNIDITNTPNLNNKILIVIRWNY